MQNEKITPEKLRILAELAGITLTEDRIQELLPHVNELQSKIHSLDDLDLEDVEPITTRLMLDSVRAAFVNDIVSIRAIVPSLRLSKFNSETYYLLEGLQPLALDAYATFTDDAEAVKRIRLYLDELRFVRPSITGESLLAEGVPEGPWIGQLLKSLLAARLDGDISSYEEEVEFVRRTLWGGS